MMRAGRRASTIGRRILLACATLTSATAACSPPDRPAATVVYASGADLESANALVTVHPLSRQVQRHALFVTLARYDSALAPQPYFARAWEWSGDRRTLTLSLVRDLRWHDGAPTTARDVAFTLEAARDPATGYPRRADLGTLSRVDVVNDTTLRLAFSVAPPGFPPILCELPILPEHLLGRVARAEMRRAPFNLAPIGNGPFRFVERQPGQRWIFARNDSFPAALGGPPRVDQLVVAVVDEPTTKFAGLVSGELDVAGIPPTMAALVERDPSLAVYSYPVLFSTALVFNPARPPLDDVRVRRALDASLDRPRIVDAALAGFGTPALGAAPVDNPLAASFPPRSPAEADALLDAAGWKRGADRMRAKEGRPLALTLLTVGSGDNAIEQLIQADFRERGIRLEIRQLEMGAFLTEARLAPRRFDLLMAGIPGDLGLSYLAAMFDGALAGGALDYANWHTPALDGAFAGVRAATSVEELNGAWAEVQRLLHEDMPVAWVYHARGVQGLSRRLRGVRMDLRGEMATLARWELVRGGEAAR
jgi:peptide/nickel transport system substrate-binding protein